MGVETNLTTNANIDITVRAIDFVTSFARQWDAYRDLMNIIRPIKKQPGTKLTMKKATVDLQSGTVTEGDIVPLSQGHVEEIEYGTAEIKKYRKSVSIEAINSKGYDAAVQMTDDELKNELFSQIITNLYTSMQTYATLRSTEGTFQMALAMALGRAIDRWKKMRKSSKGFVGFCNTLDLYRCYGAQPITIQNTEGIDYIKNFMGYETLIVTSEIPQGTVIATAQENLVNYYVDPSDSDFTRAGLKYVTDGETNLVGFNARPDYDRVTSLSDAIMGIYLFAEYPDGISLCTIDAGAKDVNLSALTIGTLKLTPKFDGNVISYTAKTTNATDVITATAEDGDATVVIKNGSTTVTSGQAATWAAGENTVTVTVTNSPSEKVYTVIVTKK